MKIVCDTNVLISGILFAGHPKRVLQMVIQGTVTNVTSPVLLSEAADVLGRPKFGLTSKQVQGIVALFHETFDVVYPVRKLRVVAKDPDDDAVIETAVAGNCEVIVSGDSHLLDIGVWKNIRIVTPASFSKNEFGEASG